MLTAVIVILRDRSCLGFLSTFASNDRGLEGVYNFLIDQLSWVLSKRCLVQQLLQVSHDTPRLSIVQRNGVGVSPKLSHLSLAKG
jgi:hypothetical protein